MQHNLRVHEHGLFLQCMADNTHADRKTFRGVIKLLQRIYDRVERNDSIQALLLEFWGHPITVGHVSWQDENNKKFIKTMLLHLINQLDNIMELQDENQPAIQKIATFLENLNHKEHEK